MSPAALPARFEVSGLAGVPVPLQKTHESRCTCSSRGRRQLSERANFLRLYAAWLAGERDSERLLLEAAGPITSSKGEACEARENRDAAEILRVLAEEEARSSRPLNPFLRYLRGKVFRAQAAKAAAIADLTASVNAFPWNKDVRLRVRSCMYRERERVRERDRRIECKV